MEKVLFHVVTASEKEHIVLYVTYVTLLIPKYHFKMCLSFCFLELYEVGCRDGTMPKRRGTRQG